MRKYRCENITKAEVIICYRNKIKDKYNKMVCDKLKIKSMTQKGAKIIAITNDLRKLGIYNKFNYVVKENKKDKIIITDQTEDIELTEEQINKNFNYSYARTLYSVQGETLKSLYYPDEDLYFIDGRTTYTLISRLKQPLKEKNIIRNKEAVEEQKRKLEPIPEEPILEIFKKVEQKKTIKEKREIKFVNGKFEVLNFD